MTFKIGTVSYHNAFPLLYGLPESQLVRLTPSKLVPSLLNHEVDVALLPSYAILEHGLHAYPEAGVIACDGTVASVGFFVRDHITSLHEVNSVFWDVDSVTSVQLAKMLLQKAYDRNLRSIESVSAEQAHTADALLLIGDKALFFCESGYRYFDLGELWKQFTGYGFQFAAWASQRPLSEAGFQTLLQAKKSGLQNRESIIASLPESKQATMRRYYNQNIVYEDTPRVRQGYALFHDFVKSGRAHGSVLTNS